MPVQGPSTDTCKASQTLTDSFRTIQLMLYSPLADEEVAPLAQNHG